MLIRLTALALLLAWCGTADAYGSLRCKGKIIDPGMSMAKVLALCGEPRVRIIEQAPVRSRNFTGFSRFAGVAFTEIWEYDRGWGKFPAILRFQDETLKRVEYGRYRGNAR